VNKCSMMMSSKGTPHDTEHFNPHPVFCGIPIGYQEGLMYVGQNVHTISTKYLRERGISPLACGDIHIQQLAIASA